MLAPVGSALRRVATRTLGPLAVATLAVGSLAIGSLAIGSLAIGSLAVGSLAAGSLAAQDRPTRPDRGRRGRAARSILVLKVGTVHPVSGPAFRNGVILIRGGRILGVGPAGKVRIPTGATVEEYPDAHAYPGLVDADSTAFANTRDLANSSVNAGSDFAEALDASDEASRELIRYGITTAYVNNRSTATWRGRGVIVRPGPSGFAMLRGKKYGGLSLRMTTGTKAGHALDRLKRFDKTGNAFDALEDYEKKRKDYEKALKEYEKKYAEYLAWFAKQKPKSPAKKATPGAKSTPGAKPAAKPPAATDPKGSSKDQPRRGGPGSGGERTGRGRRGGGRRGGFGGGRRGERGTGQPGGRSRRPNGSGARPTGRPATAQNPKQPTKDKPPKKPKWPARVKKDDAKEALLEVVHGKLPLRVEVHREDEIRAALFMAALKELPGITLDAASDAGKVAKEIAEAGSPVVVSSLLPTADDIQHERDRGALPAQLHAAGVSVAIGSGSVANAPNLTMMAAYACGKGLPEDAAVRALTLTPAKILGIADQVGSLARSKVADIVLTSGPLLRSDTRILRVLAQGRTQYEAK